MNTKRKEASWKYFRNMTWLISAIFIGIFCGSLFYENIGLETCLFVAPLIFLNIALYRNYYINKSNFEIYEYKRSVGLSLLEIQEKFLYSTKDENAENKSKVLEFILSEYGKLYLPNKLPKGTNLSIKSPFGNIESS